MLRPLFAIALLLGVLLSACVPDVAEGESDPAVDRDLITDEMIAATDATDAWGSVEKLRPNWLTDRGPRSIHDRSTGFADVFVDGYHRGKIDALRTIVASDVHEIRYLAPGPAAARYGMGYPRGIIEVTRKGRE